MGCDHMHDRGFLSYCKKEQGRQGEKKNGFKQNVQNKKTRDILLLKLFTTVNQIAVRAQIQQTVLKRRIYSNMVLKVIPNKVNRPFQIFKPSLWFKSS